MPGEGIAYITEEDIFGLRTRHAAPARAKKEKFTAALRELKEGDYVVHVKHGVGKYLGLHTRTVGDETGDFQSRIPQQLLIPSIVNPSASFRHASAISTRLCG